jgi:subtilisin-like proprotein convertase family protein
VQFWGENPDGRWQLTVKDEYGSTFLEDWRLDVYGTAATATAAREGKQIRIPRPREVEADSGVKSMSCLKTIIAVTLNCVYLISLVMY